MSPVAERLVLGVLAPAQKVFSGLFGGKSYQRKIGSLMRAVAKRLVFTLTTGTPVILFASFQLYGIGPFFRYFRFHSFLGFKNE
jgi:hypothetical protein